MAHVSGPVSSLPGVVRAAPDDVHCDNHPERLATKRVQGETDSFGAEYLDMCDECFAQVKDKVKPHTEGVCDWCHLHASDLRPRRDYDEGLYGPFIKFAAHA